MAVQKETVEITVNELIFWSGLVFWLMLWQLVNKRLFYPAYYLSLIIAAVAVSGLYLKIDTTVKTIVAWFELPEIAFYIIYVTAIMSIPMVIMLYYYLFSDYLKKVLVTSKKLKHIKI